MKINFRHYLGYGIILGTVFILAAMMAACSASAAPATSPNESTVTTSGQSASAPSGSSLTQSRAGSTQGMPQNRGTAGTLNGINGNILTLATTQGNQVTVNVTDNTSVQKTIAGNTNDLQQGVFLTVTGTQDTSGNIDASLIMINITRPQGFTAPNPGTTFTPGTRGNRQGNGTGFGPPNSSGDRATFGTLNSVSGNTLTLTTMQGGQVTINISTNTLIQKTVAGTISDLQQGDNLTVMGTADTNGNITASMISIRPAG